MNDETTHDEAMHDENTATFFSRVYKIVAKIPSGRVVSYGQIARMLGHPGAARTVGWALSACPDSLPWQRVVKADGTIAGGGFAELRRAMLLEEGVPFLTDGRIDMRACEWDGATPETPQSPDGPETPQDPQGPQNPQNPEDHDGAAPQD